jgi:hypothetical protein
MDKQSITYSLIGVLTLAVLAGVVLWSGLLDTEQDSLLPRTGFIAARGSTTDSSPNQLNLYNRAKPAGFHVYLYNRTIC